MNKNLNPLAQSFALLASEKPDPQSEIRLLTQAESEDHHRASFKSNLVAFMKGTKPQLLLKSSIALKKA